MIPAELRALPNWIVWKLETRDGKPTKVPYSVHGGFAKTNDPTTWDTYDAAAAIAAAGGFNGVGFVFTGTPYVGIDLDFKPGTDAPLGPVFNNGELAPWAREIVESLDSYTERSQSKNGLHIIVKGRLPAGGRRRGQVEAYDASSPRYFAMTGDTGIRTEVREPVNGALAEFHTKWIVGVPEPQRASGERVDSEDPRVVELVRKAKAASTGFSAMYNFGETRPGKSASESDSWMAHELARWERDPAIIEAAMRSSALARPKWSEKRPRGTVVQLAILDALESVATAVAAGPQHRFLTDDEMEHETEPPWLMPGVLPRGAVAVLYGKSSSGKSFLALDWAFRLAAEGHHVAYIAAEGWAGTKRRRRAWRLHNKVEKQLPVTFMSGNVDLLDLSNVSNFLEALRFKREGFADPALIIFDTLNQNMPGGDENAAEDMTAVIGSLNYLRRETGATILLLHHPRKSDEVVRGHSSLNNAADTMLRLTIDDANDQRVLDQTKQKDAAPRNGARYRLASVMDPDTGLEVSLVMEPTNRAEAAPAAPPEGSKPAAVLTLFHGDRVVRRADIDTHLAQTYGLSTDAAKMAGKRCIDALTDEYRILLKVAGGYRLLTSEERDAAVAQAARMEQALDNM